jgi:RNA-directed DNA polymerase
MSVWKMQSKLYLASRKEDILEVKRIQKMIVKSEAAKYKAVRTVTQDNRGKKTAGVDGKKALSPSARLALAERLMLDERAIPIRRVLIPKSDGSESNRPLTTPIVASGVAPTIEDKAKQALVRIAIEPAWEAKMEANSYGFRPGRSVHDCIVKLKLGLYRQPKYILDACLGLDQISHASILGKLESPQIIKRQIKAWLKAGVMKEGLTRRIPEAPIYKDAGTPQGGVISPLLCNIALNGLEKVVEDCLEQKKDASKKRKNKGELTYCRYADDFLVAHQDLKVILKVKKRIEEHLGELGLELSEAKTKIVHSRDRFESNEPGVNFLGFRA